MLQAQWRSLGTVTGEPHDLLIRYRTHMLPHGEAQIVRSGLSCGSSLPSLTPGLFFRTKKCPRFLFPDLRLAYLDSILGYKYRPPTGCSPASTQTRRHCVDGGLDVGPDVELDIQPEYFAKMSIRRSARAIMWQAGVDPNKYHRTGRLRDT
jgi:hypothetical protein